MDDAQQQLSERLTSANNILVTVSRNPSVDQLAACIGLALLLNKLDKHATAVFSGEVPSTMEFLQPEGTLEKNTDSLRDFIIALDKSKADKLRYKVEDQLVRIFITPYKTSISQDDLDFSQGDFNVDVVVAIGVQEQADLDTAITAHGRILHDATVSSITTTPEGGLGSIIWHGPQASSLCELIVELSHGLGQNLLDSQIATALLTGIVAETARFSNEKTSPRTMSVSSELLAAGADQQLVATKLQAPATKNKPAADEQDSESASPAPEPAKTDEDGTLEIDHDVDEDAHKDDAAPEPESSEATDKDEASTNDEDSEDSKTDDETPDEVKQDDQPTEDQTEDSPATQEAEDHEDTDAEPDGGFLTPGPKLIVDPPTLGGTLTANSRPEQLEPSIDPLGLSTEPTTEYLTHDIAPEPAAAPAPDPVPVLAAQPEAPSEEPPKAPEPLLVGFTPPPPAWVPPSDDALQATPAAAPVIATAPAPDPAVATPLNDVSLPTPQDEPSVVLPPVPEASPETAADNTLLGIEEAVHSPHLDSQSLDDARDEVQKALDTASASDTTAVTTPELKPIEALNALPLGDSLHQDNPVPAAPPVPPLADPLAPAAIPQTVAPLPAVDPLSSPALPIAPALTTDPTVPPAADLAAPDLSMPPVSPAITNAPAAPPVPPPIPYRFGNTTNS